MWSFLLLISARGVSAGNFVLKKALAASMLFSSPFSSPARHTAYAQIYHCDVLGSDE
jgi:hypothetical protein